MTDTTMGTFYYCVCHTCFQRVELGKKLWRFDPRAGALLETEIACLTRALAGDLAAEKTEEVRHGEIAFELARLAAFAFVHGHHEIEILPDTDDVILHFVEVMDSRWDDPLAHRREGVWAAADFPAAGAPYKDAAEDAFDQIATMCGCSHWEYPGQIVRDVESAIAKATNDAVSECNPCQSCGADPRVSPPTGEELPIIAGALDAQADAELRAIAASNDARTARYALAESEQRASLALRALEHLGRRNIVYVAVSAVLLVTVVVLSLMGVGAS